MKFGEMVTQVEEIDHKDIREFVEGLVREAEEIGLEFKAYGYNQLGDEGGVHIFVYSIPEGAEIQRAVVDALFTRDDDGQPNACYTIYIDEIWHFVPYYC